MIFCKTLTKKRPSSTASFSLWLYHVHAMGVFITPVEIFPGIHRMGIMAVTLTVILGKNTFYDVRDMRFVRLKQYDEILQEL